MSDDDDGRWVKVADGSKRDLLISLQHGEKTVSELVEDTGYSETTVRNRLKRFAKKGYIAGAKNDIDNGNIEYVYSLRGEVVSVNRYIDKYVYTVAPYPFLLLLCGGIGTVLDVNQMYAAAIGLPPTVYGFAVSLYNLYRHEDTRYVRVWEDAVEESPGDERGVDTSEMAYDSFPDNWNIE